MVWLRDVVLVLILLICTYTDLKRREIDHEPILIGLAFIILFNLLGLNNISFAASVLGFLLGGVTFAILTAWGMGGGDVKLMALIGLFLGWELMLLVIPFSFFAGAIVSLFYIIAYKTKLTEHIPFGPSIAIGTVLVLFFFR